MPRARKQVQWKYFSGEKGANRVRAFVHYTGTLFVEYKRGGRKVRQSLGHTNRERAKREADEIAADLRRPEREESISLRQLFDNYLREVTPTTSSTSQQHDKTTLTRFLAVLGPDRVAESLTHRDAARYARERRQGGDLRPGKKGAKQEHRPLRSRSIVYDLRVLRAVLNWGVGAGFLGKNPIVGFKIAQEESPRRPVFTETQYRALLAESSAFPWQFECLLVLAHETGHRLSAILNLQWRDVSLSSGRITWRGENDKIGYEHVTPFTEIARVAFEQARREAPGLGDAPIMPSLPDRSKPINRNLARDWLERAQKRAGLPPERGRGWHAFRRNFASELRHVGLRDLCDLGGWKDPMTVVKCYQRPSEDAMRAAQASRRVLEG